MSTLNIVEYDEIRQKIDEVKEYCDFIPDVTSKEGYEKSKRVSLDVGKLLTALEKKRKEKKAFFLEGGKQVDSQAKSIAAELEALQLPHKTAYKELDAEKKRREEARKAELEDRVAYMRGLPDMLRDHDSEAIRLAMEEMQAEECLNFYEYTAMALEVRNKVRDELGELYVKTLKAEEEARELARLREEEAERQRIAREEAIKKEAAAKAEAEKQHALDREKAAELAKIEAEKRAVEAEKRAKEEAEKAAESARLAEIKRQEDEARAEAEEAARREANKKHVGAVRKAAKEALMAAGGIDEDAAKKLVLAINSGEIPNVSIAY